MTDTIEYAKNAAQHLRKDPLFIDPAVAGRVPQATKSSIEQKLKADFPRPVKVLITPKDVASGDLATVVNAAEGKPDAAYLILTPGTGMVYARSEGPNAYRGDTSARLSSGQDKAGAQPTLTAVQTYLDVLGDPNFTAPRHDADQGQRPAVQHQPPPATHRSADGGLLLGVATPLLGIAAVAAVLVYVFRRRADRRRYALPKPLFDSARRLQSQSMQRQLSEQSLDIAGRLTELRTDALPAAQADRVEHGLDAYALAGRLIDDSAATEADLAGALVLLNTAAADLNAVDQAQASGARGARRAKRSARGAGRIPRLCAINPTHGESESTIDAPTGGGRIPACRQCAADLSAGREPDWMLAGGKPYVEGDSVWASTLYGAVGDDLVAELHRTHGA
ncbi:hypothetical protein GSY69_03250 [Brevibacterium sp. 5221]|uniref:TPM domain-containing protein n=1 Tax=Brevibacterium rongguiense TaxID=2695267 RepID=A0A6N9H528_9MICO|nr:MULTISPECIES: hypothetical protein [Brevibacterium]MYM19019.1 hypothetical protein [Brevibacterium rongguiense]WAL40692.1 hypothetical protein BRM1_02110 [Brevibacterium sp. BRM-1]